jgi:hypothetical protein
MNMENHDGMMSTEENSLFVHQSSLAIVESSSIKQEERSKEIMNLALRSIFVLICKWILHVVKSYYTGPPDLRLLRKKGVLQIFIALKNPSPRPGLNPRTLGPMASTLTITPPRRLMILLIVSENELPDKKKVDVREQKKQVYREN